MLKVIIDVQCEGPVGISQVDKRVESSKGKVPEAQCIKRPTRDSTE